MKNRFEAYRDWVLIKQEAMSNDEPDKLWPFLSGIVEEAGDKFEGLCGDTVIFHQRDAHFLEIDGIVYRIMKQDAVCGRLYDPDEERRLRLLQEREESDQS